jgi:hypothetical protein
VAAQDDAEGSVRKLDERAGSLVETTAWTSTSGLVWSITMRDTSQTTI